MEKIFLDSIKPNISFSNIYGISQAWKNSKCWNCIDEPRPKHGLMYVFCSSVHITCKDCSEMTFAKGSLLYIPKHSEYTIEFNRENEPYATVLLNFDIRDTSGKEYCLDNKVVCLADDIPPKIIEGMLNVAALSSSTVYSLFPVTKAFYEVLEKLSSHLKARKLLKEGASSVLPAVYYIDSHVLDDVTIPSLAQMCLLNESAFRKAFKEYTGMNPVQYKTHVKIKKAKSLLVSAIEIPIEEIAMSLGFYDNSYFHKIFVKQTGMTPKQYRDKNI